MGEVHRLDGSGRCQDCGRVWPTKLVRRKRAPPAAPIPYDSTNGELVLKTARQVSWGCPELLQPWQCPDPKTGEWQTRRIDYEDCIGAVALKLVERRPGQVALAYKIAWGARHDWARWLLVRARREVVAPDGWEPSGTPVGPDDLEAAEWRLLWERVKALIPRRILTIGFKAVMGERLTGAERQALYKWRRSKGAAVLQEIRGQG